LRRSGLRFNTFTDTLKARILTICVVNAHERCCRKQA
jgi:hypothetical protein